MATELAFWNFCAQGLLNIGLLSTESARASFLTQTSVVITPLISTFQGAKIANNVWLGSACALVGLALLSGIFGNVGVFSQGDVLVLAGAVCWSLYIVRLSQMRLADALSLQGAKTAILAFMYAGWLAWENITTGISWTWPQYSWITWILLVYSAIGPGALADVWQQKGQEQVSASEANVILCSEPIFTAVLAFLVAGEQTTWNEKVGGGMVVLAALLASMDNEVRDDEG